MYIFPGDLERIWKDERGKISFYFYKTVKHYNYQNSMGNVIYAKQKLFIGQQSPHVFSMRLNSVWLNPRECHKINSHFILLNKKVNILNEMQKAGVGKRERENEKKRPETRNKTMHVWAACIYAQCTMHTQFHNQRSLPVVAIS